MSQWSNRFHVLSDEFSDACSALHQSESHGSVGTMSNLPSPSIESLVHSELAVPVELNPSPPAKSFIRSARVKVSTQLDVQLQTLDTGSKVTVTALLDSGATGMFLDKKWVMANHLNTRRLPRPIPVYNVDGTLNQGGSIQEEVELLMVYQNHTERAIFAVCDLGDKAAIIGHTWLFRHNPEIDWQMSGFDSLDIKFPFCTTDF